VNGVGNPGIILCLGWGIQVLFCAQRGLPVTICVYGEEVQVSFLYMEMGFRVLPGVYTEPAPGTIYMYEGLVPDTACLRMDSGMPALSVCVSGGGSRYNLGMDSKQYPRIRMHTYLLHGAESFLRS
jgi:hypothetical protein